MHGRIDYDCGYVVSGGQELLEPYTVIAPQSKRVRNGLFRNTCPQRLPARPKPEQELVVLAMIVAVKLHNLVFACVGTRVPNRAHHSFGAAIEKAHPFRARDYSLERLCTSNHDLRIDNQRADVRQLRHGPRHRRMAMSEQQWTVAGEAIDIRRAININGMATVA